MGSTHKSVRELESAKTCVSFALEICPDHLDVATTYGVLGDVHDKLGVLERAKECQDLAHVIKPTKLGTDHTDFATSYSPLCVIHQKSGDLEQAKE